MIVSRCMWPSSNGGCHALHQASPTGEHGRRTHQHQVKKKTQEGIRTKKWTAIPQMAEKGRGGEEAFEGQLPHRGRYAFKLENGVLRSETQ